MKRWCGGAIFLVISITSIAGCATNQDAVDRDESDNYAQPPGNGITEENLGGDFGEFQFGDDVHWPDYIPSEIPEFPGEIDSVMVAPESHIRMRFSKVTDEQIEEYLALLVEEGFQLEFRIHVQEGFPDNSEERRQRGEYDDIDITKGEYHMTLWHWEGTATYDVYTSGFREEAIAATALEWPPDLPESVPQIPRCVLQTINPGHIEGYDITCRQEAENVEQEYIQLLLDAGFEEKNGTEYQDHVLEITVFENSEAIVIPSGVFSPVFSIEVIVKSEPIQLQWPEELAGLVPPPEQCKINSILPISSGNYMITCTSADENVLADYLDLLVVSGFEETGKIVDLNDIILEVTMENNTINVQLMNSTINSNIMIRVETK